MRQRSGDDTAFFPRDMRLSQKPAFLQKGHLEEAGILKPHTNADKVTSFTEIDNFFFPFSDETLLVNNTSVHRKCQCYRPRGGSLFF